jgi:protein-S-isoprenylcysteine O-methyltransferase Ste14
MVVSHATLWNNYSATVIIRTNDQIITHGIYRFTRNPIYLGLLMAVTGLPTYVGSLYGFLTSLLLIPIILNRIRLVEEETTRKLIPFVYRFAGKSNASTQTRRV